MSESAPDKQAAQKTYIFSLLLLLAGFAILVGLGVWQVQRQDWKDTLIAAVETEKAQSAKHTLQHSLTDNTLILKRGHISGGFIKNTLLLLGPRNTQDMGSAYYLMAPFIPDRGPVVFVVLGSLPVTMSKQSLEDIKLPTHRIRLAGTLKEGEKPGFLKQKNNRYLNIWRLADPLEMAAALGIGWVSSHILYQEEGLGYALPSYVQPVAAVTELRNNHTYYAVFWFVMACLWLALIFLWVVKPSFIAYARSSEPAK